MNRVIIDRNPFEVWEGSRHEFETEDLFGLIRQEFPQWPSSARLYYDSVAAERDVTPISEADIEAIKRLPDGTFHVVVYPGDPGSIIVNLILVAILSAASYLLTPKLSGPTQPADRRIDDASPNNALSNRTNQARPNGRIPDIFGTVRSTPDLLAVPHSIFVDHQEIEHAYMCIGRGEYDVDDIRDGDTPIGDIDGASVEVYAPNKSPNSGHAAQVTIGDAINRAVTSIAKLSAVNGQVLVPTNSGALIGASNIKFQSTNKIINDASFLFGDYFDAGNPQQNSVTVTGGGFNNNHTRFMTGVTVKFAYPNIINRVTAGDFRDHFKVGEDITVPVGATYTDGITTVDLAGTYEVATVTSAQLTLVNPGAINADWNDLDDFAGDETANVSGLDFTAEAISGTLNGTYDITAVTDTQVTLSSPVAVNSDWNKLARIPGNETILLSPTLTPSFDRRIGPFILPGDQITQVICNFIALNGLYADNGVEQSRLNLGIEIELREIDAAGAPLGSWETFTSNIVGSAVTRSTRARTVTLVPAAGAGRYEIRAQLTSAYNFGFTGTIVDELKWRDCYTSTPSGMTHFGNVTTIQSMTRATERALAVKERKLNLLASRKIPRRDSGGFTSTLFTTSKFELILYAVAIDPYIGRRSVAELDLIQMDAIADAVRAYFGDDELAEFNYTFDKTGMSFEETALAIAGAAFCQPYRQGNQLRLAFERENEDSSLLFNHRNKVPKSEVRTFRFGNVKDFDGIEFNYIDPEDDAIETYYIPTDRSATAPKKIDSIGIRNHKQPYVHAWREWNKMLFQRESTKFDALSEAELLVPNDRILVSDNTRPDTMDGEVVSQSSLTLTLSQAAVLDTGAAGYAAFNAYTIHLQHIDGTVEAIGIKQGATTKEILLENAPSVALSLDPQNSVRTGYVIIKADDPRTSAFLVIERDNAKDRFIYPVTAINYDTRYYAEDLNFPA